MRLHLMPAGTKLGHASSVLVIGAEVSGSDQCVHTSSFLHLPTKAEAFRARYCSGIK
jgi:hypothetical protein